MSTLRLADLVERAGLIRPFFAARFFLVRLKPSALWRNFRYGGTSKEETLPSAWARIRVAGTIDRRWFLESGSLAAESVRDAVHRVGHDIGEFDRILDFGCGCGRVLRHWRSLERANIFGTDYQHRLVKECHRVVPFAQLAVNGLEPSLPFVDASFDLIYSFSVFTHLDERQQVGWRNEIRRVLKPGGLFVMSTQGPAYLNKMNDAERARFEAGDVICQRQKYRGQNICQTYHPESYVRGPFADGLSVLLYVREGAKGNPPQDLYVLQRGDSTATA